MCQTNKNLELKVPCFTHTIQELILFQTSTLLKDVLCYHGVEKDDHDRNPDDNTETILSGDQLLKDI